MICGRFEPKTFTSFISFLKKGITQPRRASSAVQDVVDASKEEDVEMLAIAEQDTCTALPCRVTHVSHTATAAPTSRSLLLLVLYHLNIILGHLPNINTPLLDLIRTIALYRDLLPTTRRLRHATARRKLLSPLLRHLLQVQAMRLEPGHARHVFSLVPLHPLDLDYGLCFRSAGSCFLGSGFGFLLCAVFGGTFLGVDGEGRELARYGFCDTSIQSSCKEILHSVYRCAEPFTVCGLRCRVIEDGRSRGCPDLRYTAARANRDDSSSAILRISWPCPHIRNTKAISLGRS